MKKLYWRPPGVSRTALVLVAVLALGALAAVETFPVVRKQHAYATKIAAARLARQCMEAIKAEKKRRNLLPDSEVDPAGTGMIGESITQVTSNTGFLTVKRTSTNPNFAAVLVHLLDRAGVKAGETVAVGVTGSFPALNVATFAAVKTLRLRPIVIASTSSSEWGANHVDYLWLDMEQTLRRQHLIDFQTAAATHGGIDDLGIGLTKQGHALLDAAIARSGARKIEPVSLTDAIDKRLALYDELAGDIPIRAYINVGGGSASVGTHVGKKQFKPGLNREPPREPNLMDSVMLRFAKRDVPVIHISRIKLLAERYELPDDPQAPVPIGQGTVFVKSEPNRWLALAGLLTIMAVMLAFIRWDIGARVLRTDRPRQGAEPPEPMV